VQTQGSTGIRLRRVVRLVQFNRVALLNNGVSGIRVLNALTGVPTVSA